MMPVRSLPVAQNWDCNGCGACCRSYHVPVSEVERKRIDAQGWEADPELAAGPRYVPAGRGEFHLAHRPDGSCVFLGPDSRCRIHAKFGSAAKPLACRVYPFVLVPAGDHWRVGLRFACPTAAADRGRPLADHLPEVREYAAALEADAPQAVGAPPTPLEAGRAVPWADLGRAAGVLSQLLGNAADPLERRWRVVLKLAELCRGLKLDGPKPVTGGRLTELLTVLGAAAAEETPRAADAVPRPGWAGRMVFRQVAAVYARKDHGADKGTAQRTPVGRVRAAAAFARGWGRVPPVHALIPDGVRFADAERPAGPLGKASDALLTRYYRLKVESLQLCGPTNFGVPFWEGVGALALTFPAVLWLSRVLAAGGMARDEAVARALRVVDDNFGYNPLLGRGRQRLAVRLVAGRGELARLVAWYAR